MFSPPWEIIFKGPLEDAIVFAERSNKWLLINVQDEGEFACQVLNRDVWSHEGLKRFVGDHFVFVQPNIELGDGKWYQTFYPIEMFPHIAVMDPVTKQRVMQMEGPVEAKDLAARLRDFLGRLPNPTAATPNPGVAAVADAEHVDEAVVPLNKKRKSEIDHEEELQRAIAESLSSVGSDMRVEDDEFIEYDDNNQKQLLKDGDEQEEDMEEEEEEQDLATLNALQEEAQVPPPSAPTKKARSDPGPPRSSLPADLQIRIRKQDGSSFILNVNQEDSVAYLHHVAASYLSLSPSSFTLTLTYPRKVLTHEDPSMLLSSLGITRSVTLVLGLRE